MATYQLNINFTNDQLQAIEDTASSVIIAKPPSNGGSIVAWQSFSPLQNNTVTWDEEFGIYVSNSQVVNGANLDQLSSVPIGAAMDKLYTLQDSGIITGPDAGGEANSFSLLNQYSKQPYITVGLYQDATVNGTDIIGNAISAAPELLASTAVITPYTTVYVWLQSNVSSNSVVTTVTSPMSSSTFGGGVDDITLVYDSESGTFNESQ